MICHERLRHIYIQSLHTVAVLRSKHGKDYSDIAMERPCRPKSSAATTAIHLLGLCHVTRHTAQQQPHMTALATTCFQAGLLARRQALLHRQCCSDAMLLDTRPPVVTPCAKIKKVSSLVTSGERLVRASNRQVG